MSWTGVITNAGQTLLNTWGLGGHTLTITKATVGSGYVSDANMKAATALNSQKDNAPIVRYESVEGGTRLKVQVGPIDGTAYTLHEVGIWGHLDSDSTDTLIALHQDSSGGIAIPTETDSPDFAVAMYFVHAISNDDTLTVTVDQTAHVTESDLNDAVESTIETLAKVYTQSGITGSTADEKRDNGFKAILLSMVQADLADTDIQTALTAGTTVNKVRSVMFCLIGTSFDEKYSGTLAISYVPNIVSSSLYNVRCAIQGTITDGEWGVYGSYATYKIGYGVATGTGANVFDPTVYTPSYKRRELIDKDTFETNKIVILEFTKTMAARATASYDENITAYINSADNYMVIGTSVFVPGSHSTSLVYQGRWSDEVMAYDSNGHVTDIYPSPVKLYDSSGECRIQFGLYNASSTPNNQVKIRIALMKVGTIANA